MTRIQHLPTAISIRFVLLLALTLITCSGGCEKSGSREVAWPDVSGKLAEQADGTNDAAVIVGLERYQALAAIPGAEQNSLDWYRYLTNSRGVPRGRVRHLMNNDAKSYAIKGAVQEMAGQVRPGGRFWFIFIGHGAHNEQEEPLLVGYDAELTVNGLAERSLRQADVLDWMKQGEAIPVALFDACFSGSSRSGEALVPGLQPSAVVESVEAPLGGVVLTAARSNEFAGPLPGANRPAFSYLALAGLRGWADHDEDGLVTAQEVRDYVDETLRDFLRGERSQTPTITGRTDMSLAPRAEPAPDMQALVAQFRGEPDAAPGGEPVAAAQTQHTAPTMAPPPPAVVASSSAASAPAPSEASNTEALSAANAQLRDLQRAVEERHQWLGETQATLTAATKACLGEDAPVSSACDAPNLSDLPAPAGPEPRSALEHADRTIAIYKQALMAYGMALENCNQTLAEVRSQCPR